MVLSTQGAKVKRTKEQEQNIYFVFAVRKEQKNKTFILFFSDSKNKINVLFLFFCSFHFGSLGT